ncbi:MFS transporter [Nonomuraea sp. NPDC050783]|uniref:MFS transporter n=1 Tax=Nonomuraea sp. NPDC050783 TaxID=3154634 RepID=UPI003465C786
MTGRLLACTGAGFLSIGLLIPAIPKYVVGPLGQQTGVVGLSLAVTAAAGVLARPFAGRLADRAGRRAASCAGAAILAATCLGLLASGSLPAFLCCRALAGVGEALLYVGLAALASDQERPGRAIDRFSAAVNAGLLAGPVVAELVQAAAGFAAVWALAAAAAAVAAVSCLLLDAGPVAPARGRLVHRAGIRPGLGYLASVWGYTAFTGFLPLHVLAVGGTDAGPHFLLYGCVLMAVRLGGGRLTAEVAAPRLALASLVLTAAGLILLAAGASAGAALWAAAVIGAGQGLGLPAFLKTAVTGLAAAERGAAVATTTAFFDLGFLCAAPALGALTQSAGLPGGFASAAAVAAGGALLFLPIHRDPGRGAVHDPSPR